MNEGQSKFFEFIMACTKDDCREKAKTLLTESFERQSSGRFDLPFFTKFNVEIKDYIKEEKQAEVMAVLSKFGKAHLS